MKQNTPKHTEGRIEFTGEHLLDERGNNACTKNNAVRIALCWNMHEELVEALRECERAMMQARYDSGKVDDANGDRLLHNGKKLFPCNQAVVHATQESLDKARTVLRKLEP